MRIIRISTRIFPDLGGPAKQAYLLSKYLSQNDIKVINISCIPKNKKFIKKERVNKNFDVIYLPFHAPGVNSSIFSLFLFFIKFFIYGSKEIIRIIRDKKVDLIHAHTPLPSGFIAFFIHKLFKIPYFYTIHGLDIPTPFLLKFDFKFSAKDSIKTFVVSKKLDYYIKNFFNLSNIQRLPNSIELSKFFHIENSEQKADIIQKLNLSSVLSKDDFIIIYIGYMFHYQKVRGMIDFLEGYKMFLNNINQKNINKIKLLFIGNGKYSYLVEKRINELDLKNHAYLLGKREDVHDLLAISDLLALTSYNEGFPNVILEAMASKVPCLGSDVGDIRYIINESGYIIRPGDIKAIEKNLIHHYNLPHQKKIEIIEKSYNRIKNRFDLIIVGKNLMEFYKLRK